MANTNASSILNSFPTWSKPIFTIVYSVSGWVITEIPVALNIIPATIDGYSTAGVVGALGFVLSAAYFVHSHLSPGISVKPTNSTPTGSGGTSPAQPAPNSFTLDSNSTNPKVGQMFTLSVEYGTPNGTFAIYEVDNNQPVTASYSLDANGNGSITFNPLNTVSPIGFLINANGGITIEAKDSAGKVSQVITLGSPS